MSSILILMQHRDVAALADTFLFAPEPLLPVTVRSLAAVRVVCIPRESLLVICQRSRAFLENYLRDAGSRLAALSERFRIMQFSALRGRLADWILRHAHCDPAPRCTGRAGLISRQPCPRGGVLR
ncbi:MAG: hypothetical protein ABSF43_10480 [Rectinemataceae bacterium]